MPMVSTETARVPEDISGRQRRVPVGGITWRHNFRALRHRNYRLFFCGQLVSLIGTWMQQTAMSWFVYEITNSKFLLGLVSAVGSAPMVFSSVWGGSLADLYPKRSILVATQSAQMICAFLLAAGVWLGFASPWFIVIIAGLNGLAMGFDMPARQAFTVEMTSREDLLNAISLNSSIVNGARVVGPSVAGLMIGAVGVAMCFFLNGLSFVAVIGGLLMMRLPPFWRPHTLSLLVNTLGEASSIRSDINECAQFYCFFLQWASLAGRMLYSCQRSHAMCWGAAPTGTAC
jgi:MFS family permease